MKKTIIIFLLLSIVSSITFSQKTNELIYNISEVCGKDLIKKIQHNEINIKKALDTKNTLKIVILPIKNHNNKITSISIELAKNLTNIIQQDIRPQIPNFETYIVEYSDIKNNNSETDYFLVAQYQLNDNQFLIYNISLEPINNLLSPIAIESSVCNVNIDILKPIDISINKGKIIFIESVENIFEQTTQIISGQVTTQLTETGYSVEKKQDNALFKIKVKVTAREQKKSFGVYFSYADIHIEIIDIKTGNRIFIKDYVESGGVIYLIPMPHKIVWKIFQRQSLMK